VYVIQQEDAVCINNMGAYLVSTGVWVIREASRGLGSGTTLKSWSQKTNNDNNYALAA